MSESEIYESIRWDLMRYATALTGPNTAEDVVSSVVTRVLGHSGGLSGLRDAKQYLMRSILNAVTWHDLFALPEALGTGLRPE